MKYIINYRRGTRSSYIDSVRNNEDLESGCTNKIISKLLTIDEVRYLEKAQQVYKRSDRFIKNKIVTA